MIYEIDREHSDNLKKYVNTFVEDNILKTFNSLWDERDYWCYKPLVYKIDNEIVAFTAYTIDEKYPGKLKVYYLHTRKEFRGQKIAKQLLRRLADIAHIHNKDMLYITEENTDGSKLFGNLEFETKLNEFGTVDKIYEINKKILNKFFI